MSTNTIKSKVITNPSDAVSGRVERPESTGSTISSKRTRPSLLASVGKIFNRSSGKKKSSEKRAPTTVYNDKVDDSVKEKALTPVEEKYKKIAETSADRTVRTVLNAL